MHKDDHLVGNVYGRLTVLNFEYYKYEGKRKSRRSYYNCKCICGNFKIASGHRLHYGGTKSCGCLVIDRAKEMGRINGLKLGREKSGFTGLYSKYKKGASRRNLEFSLTQEDFEVITSMNCHYCNKPPIQTHKKQAKYSSIPTNYIYNGIDRKDNNIGYNLINSLPCCKYCNWMKRTMNYEEFLEHIKSISLNLKLINGQ